MSYEKPQKGNPHELTIKQHTFPATSINRFYDNDGLVNVYLMAQSKNIRVKSDNNLFCAMRAWDQRAEAGFMKEIEDKYQSLAEEIVSGNTKHLNANHQAVITDMFAIWNIRHFQKRNPIAEHKIEGILDVAVHYSKDEEEILEKNGITVIRPDFTISGRSNTGTHLQMNLLEVRNQMADAQWGILSAMEGEFIVPDNFSNARILPLSPTKCLFSQSLNDDIDVSEVSSINRMAIESAEEYYFASDLSKCPT